MFVFASFNYNLSAVSTYSLRLRYDHIFLNPTGVWSMLYNDDTPAGTVMQSSDSVDLHPCQA